MKTQYFTATSLDGFIADSRNSLDWLFQFGGGPGEDYDRFIEQVGAIAMGSTTYEWLLENEIYKDPENPKPWSYKQPCWVFTSRSLRLVEGADVRFVKGDVVAVHREMTVAANGANVWVVGGGELVGQFHDHGLLDDIFLGVAPVILGGGAPLLPRRISTPPLKLISSKVIEGAFLQLHYEVQKD
ncbi:MAG: dihydrofolate reductase family protein [Candidatus Obscuribacterales bacterium]|nr:dihydrofolate reductase family protein [Candidatus Obscuribacterales bacterium]